MRRDQGNSMKRLMSAAACLLGVALLLPGALAEDYDAQSAQAWLSRFAEALGTQAALNNPAETVDPARSGQALIEYAFGTVTARRAPSANESLSADDIIEVNVTGDQVTDCRGVRVGMPLESALGGARVERGVTQLSVLGTQEAGIGWSWAYVGDAGVYGVEYVSYGQKGEGLSEYTLTYVIDGNETVSAIRMRVAGATQAQAEDALKTAQEIAQRQQGELLAARSDAPAFGEADLQVMGGVLGAPVASWVSRLGEPVEIQTLPGGGGRMLLYEGAVLRLGLNEQTGEEIVLGVSASGSDIPGPRGLRTGMSVQEAAALFTCEQDVCASGGLLYLLGEALGEPPYGELVREEGGVALRYAAATASGRVALLEAGIQDGLVAYWHLYYEDGEEERADGG